MSDQGARIVELRVENAMRVKLVVIRPGDDPLVQITGKNAQGKSSTLNALGWLFDGKGAIPADPIRAGADRAVIQADLGDIIVRRTLNRQAGGGFTTTLYAEAAGGARFQKPQQVVDGFLGALSLDPVAFMRQEPKVQFDTLRRFVPGVDFEATDKANAADFARRTDINREIARLRAAAAAIRVSADLPDDPVDEAALLQEMTTAAQTNADIVAERTRRGAAADDVQLQLEGVTAKRTRASDLRRQAAEFDAQADEAEAKAKAALEAHAALPPLRGLVDVSDVRQQIEEARTTNAGIAKRIERDSLSSKAAEQEWLADALTDAIDTRNEEKKEAIAAAEMPVPGLGFGDGIVLLNGHPLNQASGAEQLRASVAIAMAMNPKLRVIRVRDGNSLDRNGMRLLTEMAEKHGYQVWVERIEESGVVGFVIEDGEVVHTPHAEAA
jgi:energy-coupling factor transporter ATP-binding protein EcfA2